MSDTDPMNKAIDASILDVDHKTRLAGDVLILMLKGAGYAAALVLAIWASIAILQGIGALLPADSKTAPDPTPTSHLEVLQPRTTSTAVA